MRHMTWFTMATLAAEPGAEQIVAVLDNLRNLLVSLLLGLAIASLTYAGVRYLVAAGDPTAVERAKQAVKSALVGFALALLAPVLVGIVKNLIGG